MRPVYMAVLPGLLVPVLMFSFASCSESNPTLDGSAQRPDSSLGNAPDGYVSPNDPVAQCQTVGGAISLYSCCKNAPDFPNRCDGLQCSCDLAESKETTICTCPGNDLCWDGKRCVPR